MRTMYSINGWGKNRRKTPRQKKKNFRRFLICMCVFVYPSLFFSFSIFIFCPSYIIFTYTASKSIWNLPLLVFQRSTFIYTIFFFFSTLCLHFPVHRVSY